MTYRVPLTILLSTIMVIVSNRSDLRMVFQIINTSTGEVVAIWVPQGSPAVGKE